MAFIGRKSLADFCSIALICPSATPHQLVENNAFFRAPSYGLLNNLRPSRATVELANDSPGAVIFFYALHS